MPDEKPNHPSHPTPPEKNSKRYLLKATLSSSRLPEENRCNHKINIFSSISTFFLKSLTSTLARRIKMQEPNSALVARASYRRCRAGRTSTLQGRRRCCPRRARRRGSLRGQVLRRTSKESCCRTQKSWPGHLLPPTACRGAHCRGCNAHRVPVGTGRETKVRGGVRTFKRGMFVGLVGETDN